MFIEDQKDEKLLDLMFIEDQKDEKLLNHDENGMIKSQKTKEKKYNIPENLFMIDSHPFLDYENVYPCHCISDVKWPCCVKCTVLRLGDINSIDPAYKLVGCKKHKNLKENIYSSEEFDKLLRFRSYLSLLRLRNSTMDIKYKYNRCDSEHDLYPCVLSKTHICDVCDNKIVDQLNKALRCATCDYDVCYKCQITNKKPKRLKIKTKKVNNNNNDGIKPEPVD
jgi:hypothetical protein